MFFEIFQDCQEQSGILFRKHQAKPEKTGSESLERGAVPDHKFFTDQEVEEAGCRERRIQNFNK